MTKKILTANLNVMKVGSLGEICNKLDIEIEEIKSDNFHDSLSSVTGMQGDKRPLKDDAATPGEFIVFYGFNADDLDEFLDEAKAKSLVIPYKAMSTVHNLSWSPAYLYQELVKEHEKMK